MLELLSVGSPKPERSRGYEPDKERCLGEGNSIANFSIARNIDNITDFKHRAHDAQDDS